MVVNDTIQEYIYAKYNDITGDLNATDIRVGALDSTQLDEMDIQPLIQPSKEVLEKECGKYCTNPSEDFDKFFSFTHGGLTIKESGRVQMRPGPRLLRPNQQQSKYNGVLRNIVILMQFSDHTERDPIPRGFLFYFQWQLYRHCRFKR